MNAKTRISCGVLLGAALAACSSAPSKPEAVAHMIQPQRVTEHRGHDDLLTAGLGLDGLRAMAAPAFADPAQPTAAELRRRAIWGNWRGIADLSPTGGYGQAYGSVASVPGRGASPAMACARARWWWLRPRSIQPCRPSGRSACRPKGCISLTGRCRAARARRQTAR